MSRPRSFLLLCLYGLLCCIEWLCSKGRYRIEHLLFPPPKEEPRP